MKREYFNIKLLLYTYTLEHSRNVNRLSVYYEYIKLYVQEVLIHFIF